GVPRRSGGQVPHPNRPVLAGRGQGLPVGADGQREDLSRVTDGPAGTGHQAGGPLRRGAAARPPEGVCWEDPGGRRERGGGGAEGWGGWAGRVGGASASGVAPGRAEPGW